MKPKRYCATGADTTVPARHHRPARRPERPHRRLTSKRRVRPRTTASRETDLRAEQIKVPPHRPTLDAQIVSCRCGVRTCPVAGCGRGWENDQRHHVRAATGLFDRPRMLSLTVNPGRFPFSSPEEAHERVTAKKCIPTLMKSLGIAVWVWILEFQENGWPHWHVLVDLPADDRTDVEVGVEATRLWKDRFRIGGIDGVRLSPVVQGESSYDAVHRISGYMTKPPKEAFPDWVLQTHGTRFIGGSKAFSAYAKGSAPARMARKSKPDCQSVKPSKKTYAQRRTLAERMAGCGKTCRVFHRTVDCGTGEVRGSFAADIPISIKELRLMLPAVREETVSGRKVVLCPTRDVQVLCDHYANLRNTKPPPTGSMA